jgi:nitroreductase
MPGSLVETIKNRRTIHQFKVDELPPVEIIREAIEQAVWAPNHHLTQPWLFHLIGPQTAESICQLNSALVKDKKGEKAAEIKLRRWREVPGWLVLSCRKAADELTRKEDYAACCCVAHNLSLILWEKGLGMKWTTGAVTREPGFFDIIGLDSQQHSIIGLFWYGYPADIPKATRLAVSESIAVLP